MQTKNYKPTAAQKRFWDWIANNTGWCAVCGVSCAGELHHILGAAAKHNRVHIGQWLLMKLCTECNHDNLRLPSKSEQIGIYLRDVLNPYWHRFGDVPMSKEELLAIVTWRP